MERYFLNDEETCGECSENCLECKNETTCTKCDGWAYEVDEGRCEYIPLWERIKIYVFVAIQSQNSVKLG